MKSNIGNPYRNRQRSKKMNQKIKAGDYVYIPHYSRKALLVQSGHTRI